MNGGSFKIATFAFFSERFLYGICFLHHYCYYNLFTTLCPWLPRWVGTRRINHSGFCWSRHDGVAVASAEPYASYLHFVQKDNHASTSSVRFLHAGRSSWHPTNSVKALKALFLTLTVGDLLKPNRTWYHFNPPLHNASKCISTSYFYIWCGSVISQAKGGRRKSYILQKGFLNIF